MMSSMGTYCVKPSSAKVQLVPDTLKTEMHLHNHTVSTGLRQNYMEHAGNPELHEVSDGLWVKPH